MRRLSIELIPDPEQGGYTARLPDIPAYDEGESEQEAIADLKEAVLGYIETFSLDDALARLVQTAPQRQNRWPVQNAPCQGSRRPLGDAKRALSTLARTVGRCKMVHVSTYSDHLAVRNGLCKRSQTPFDAVKWSL